MNKEQENKQLKERYERLKQEHIDTITRNEEKQQRIDKAIDKLNNMKDTYYESNMANDMQNIFDLLDILKGVDKE